MNEKGTVGVASYGALATATASNSNPALHPITPGDTVTTNTSTSPDICGECGRPHYRKRERMPLDHAVQTVEGILVGRLDDLYHQWIQGDGGRFGLAEDDLLELLQSLQITLFPTAFGAGEPYTPDVNGRMDVPPIGLFKRRPTEVIFARHVIEQERATAAGRMKLPDGAAVFNDNDLAVLRVRRGQRESRVALVK